MAAVLSLACDFHNRDTYHSFRDLLTANSNLVGGWLSVPVDEYHDAIAVMLRGSVEKVQKFADRIRTINGMSGGQLSIVRLNEPHSPD